MKLLLRFTGILILVVIVGIFVFDFVNKEKKGVKKVKTKTFKNDFLNVHHHVLENGLNVYLIPNDSQAKIYAEIVVAAGSKQDPQESTGLAHYLEHLLFKGTSKLSTIDYQKEKVHLDNIENLYEELAKAKGKEEKEKIYSQISQQSLAAANYAIPSEFDQLYQKIGADAINAHTSFDETVYKVRIPSNQLEKWAKIESQRFMDPVFRLFQHELETVYEEKNRSIDNAGSLLYWKTFAKIFPNHPYENTILGKKEHLKNPSIKNIKKYFDNYYNPNNIAIVMCGDLEVDTTLEIIKKYFSEWKNNQQQQENISPVTKIKGIVQEQFNYPDSEAITIAFQTVANDNDDVSALEIFDMLLANSKAGLLDILKKKKKVYQVGAFPMILNDAGTQIFYGEPKKGQTLEQVKELIFDQIKKIQKGDFDEKLLQGVVNDFILDREENVNNLFKQVEWVRDSFINGKSWQWEIDKINRYKKITKQDIIRVANQYFGEDYVEVIRKKGEYKVKKIAKPKIPTLDITNKGSSPFALSVEKMETSSIQLKAVDFDNLYQEQEVFLAKQKIGKLRHYKTDKNIFSLKYIFPHGKRDNFYYSLLFKYLEVADKEGMTLKQFEQKLYFLGISLEVELTDNETIIELFGLTENFEKGIDLLNGYFSPVWDSENVSKVVDATLKKRQIGFENKDTMRSAMVYYSRYGQDSPFFQCLSTSELKKVNQENIKNSLKDFFTTKDLLIEYTGKDSLKKITSENEKVIASNFSSDDKQKIIFRSENRYAQPKQYSQPEIHFLNKKGLSQSSIAMGFVEEKNNSNDEAIYNLFNEYFDGSMGSIVFEEVRSLRALAYSVFARFFYQQEQEKDIIFFSRMGTQIDKSKEASQVLLDLIKNPPIIEEKFRVAKQALLSKYNTSRILDESLLSTIRAWQKKGFVNQDPRVLFLEKINNYQIKDIKKFVKEKLKNQNLIINILTDLETGKINVEEIKKIVGYQKSIVFDKEVIFGNWRK